MATATVTKTSVTIEYAGDGGRSGGTYSFSGIKHTAGDADLHLHAQAVNSLQEKTAAKVFKVVESELSE